MRVAPIIHIGGWPGAGKRSIGAVVAERLGGRLIDNHLMLDAARALYARGTDGSSALREEVREVILAHARALPPDIPIVLTDALAEEPAAIPLFQPTLDLARDRGATLKCFVLDLTLDANLMRLTDPGRSGRAKLRDAEVLREIRAKERLYLPEGAMVLDVSNLSVADAAARIIRLLEDADA